MEVNIEFVNVTIKILLGVSASVLAIALWSKKRNAPNLFIALGVVALDFDIIFGVLLRLGIIARFEMLSYVLPVVFSSFPLIFFIIAFIIAGKTKL
jgi:hypothetical protein